MKPFLSILIPIFNENVENLIESLAFQISKSDSLFEIICFDDASTDIELKQKNKLTASNHNILYQELPHNVGRSAIRNQLADTAKGEFILFLDCDMAIMNENYIKNLTLAAQKYDIFSGGTCYQKEKPIDTSKTLHWLAGTQKEDISIEQKQKTPLAGFSLNNLCIKREIFLQINLDPALTQYGHEDTLFGYFLLKNNYKINFIDNKVLHLGLNSSSNFIHKNLLAIENLIFLKTNKNIELPTRLTQMGNKLISLKIGKIYRFIFSFLEKSFLKNLNSQHPNLLLFDMLKLDFYLKLSKI